MLDGLLDGYGARPEALGWHLAAAILGRAAHPFHRQLPGWPDRVEAMLRAAEDGPCLGRCVTGCAGFVGSHLTEALLADGHEVVGVDCFSDNYPARREAGEPRARARRTTRFELHSVDLATADVARLLDGCDVVFHLAAEPGVRTSWGARFDRFVHNNVEATQRLLEALRARAGHAARLRLLVVGLRRVRAAADAARTRRRGRSRPTA